MPLTGRPRNEIIASSHAREKDSLVYEYSGTAIVSYGVGSNVSELRLETTGQFEFDIRNSEDMPRNTAYSPGADGIYRMDRAPNSLSQVTAIYYNDDLFETLQSSLMAEANWNAVQKDKAHNRVLKEVVSPSVTEKFTEVAPHYLATSQQWVLRARKEFPDGTSTHVRLTELGRGLQRVIVPLLLFEATKPSIGLWDDIEAGMHPSLLENVLKWLFKKDWQMVISTQSIDVLSTMAKIRPKDTQVIMLSKSADDLLSYKILDMESFADLIDAGQDPRQIVNLL
jgi:hypothetical protein